MDRASLALGISLIVALVILLALIVPGFNL
jgi:hypothetical protein